MKVSAKLLRRKGACEPQVQLFESLFGYSEVEVTEALCIEHAKKFDWNWVADAFLSVPAWEDYQRVEEVAHEEYERTIASAWEELKRAKALAHERIPARRSVRPGRISTRPSARVWQAGGDGTGITFEFNSEVMT